MKVAVTVLLIVLAVVIFTPKVREAALAKVNPPATYAEQAQRRVELVLKGMQIYDINQLEVQTAVCQWAQGVSYISDNQQLSWASDNFDKFRQARGLYRKIDEYEIVEVVEDESAETPTAKVKVMIDGKQYTMIVPEKQPIRWKQLPPI